jgi:NADPH:quinone reductase-like Zn-dependent oxidoreductase
MRAILRRRYGGPEVLTLEDLAVPTPLDDQVLVRVHAASVNAYDWHMLRGKPYLARLTEGLRRPKAPEMGVDCAGVVEAVGSKVEGIRIGDRVFGGRNGAFGEYVAGRNFVRMPDDLSFEDAASIPMAALTALQGLRDKAGLQPGEHVLVTGAGGGVGTSAVQLARALGAGRVTATTSRDKLEHVRSIGADEVLDHEAQDVTTVVRDVDVLFDVGGHGRLSQLRRTLSPTGRIVLVGPGRGEWLGPVSRVVTAALGSRFTRQKALPFLSHHDTDDLTVLRGFLESGALRPVVERTYPLESTADAIAHLESGRVRGKVVIAVA